MSLPHDSAHTHVTGQSEYIEDRPCMKDELHIDLVYSTEAHAEVLSLDLRQVKKAPGVVAVFTAKDLHHNCWGSIFQDQPLLASEKVTYVGEVLAIVAAVTADQARAARSLAKVKYRTLSPVLSISAAIKAKSFIAGERKIERGDVVRALTEAPYRHRDHIVLRGAEHFYLENQASVAYPREDGQIEVHSSSQHPTEVQHVVAHALGIPDRDVVCIVKRMGGAFGGKESQGAPFAAYAALVAYKCRRAARIALTKDDDMVATGKRNPFEIHYEVGFDDEGRLLALDSRLYSDGGAYADLSTAIMERAMLHSDNAYFVPDVRIIGQVCKTHFHPHTAFRGFGGPKGVGAIEKIIEAVARQLKRDPLDVRKLNCYRAENGRDVTPYGQKVENNVLPELFEKLELSCRYRERRNEIERSNRQALAAGDGRPLRGLALTPVKFGISFTTRFLNQANALVIVHRDGTLQVSTGATEMGQGVNARIAELVASEFGLGRGSVRVMPTSTDKNANTSPTAASSGTDLNGAAAARAARRIKRRLSELAAEILARPESDRAKYHAGLGSRAELDVNLGEPAPLGPNDGANWETGTATYAGICFVGGEVFVEAKPGLRLSFGELVNEAYLNRVSLSEYAHYKIPGLSFDKITGKGRAFLYYTQGTAASEVSVDPDTGEVKILRTDILMDLGRTINRDLDIGQVSGGFVQGAGWMTTEKLYYSEKGELLSHAPSTYKIPNIQDTPRIFNIELLSNDGNRDNLRGTKAVGEPPLLLAFSVWCAIHDALGALPDYRRQLASLEVPATSEQILRAVERDRFNDLES